MQEINLSDDQIDLDDYEIDGKLGRHFLQATHKKTKEKFALNVLDEGDCMKLKRTQVRIIYKLKVLRNLNIPGIVQLKSFGFPLLNNEISSNDYSNIQKQFKIQLNSDSPIFLMEYMKVNNLSSIKKEYIESKGLIHDVLNPTIRSKIVFGVSAIMKKVHQKNIIFKELKIENIYLDDKLEPQINMLKTIPFRIEDFDIYFRTRDITPPEAFYE